MGCYSCDYTTIYKTVLIADTGDSPRFLDEVRDHDGTAHVARNYRWSLETAGGHQLLRKCFQLTARKKPGSDIQPWEMNYKSHLNDLGSVFFP